MNCSANIDGLHPGIEDCRTGTYLEGPMLVRSNALAYETKVVATHALSFLSARVAKLAQRRVHSTPLHSTPLHSTPLRTQRVLSPRAILQGSFNPIGSSVGDRTDNP